MRECVIHGTAIRSWDELYDRLAADLAFPDWFGRNLDALYDCLTDLPEAQITVYGWNRLAETLGEKSRVLYHVLTEAGLESPGLVVSLLEDQDEEI